MPVYTHLQSVQSPYPLSEDETLFEYVLQKTVSDIADSEHREDMLIVLERVFSENYHQRLTSRFLLGEDYPIQHHDMALSYLLYSCPGQGRVNHKYREIAKWHLLRNKEYVTTENLEEISFIYEYFEEIAAFVQDASNRFTGRYQGVDDYLTNPMIVETQSGLSYDNLLLTTLERPNLFGKITPYITMEGEGMIRYMKLENIMDRAFGIYGFYTDEIAYHMRISNDTRMLTLGDYIDLPFFANNPDKLQFMAASLLNQYAHFRWNLDSQDTQGESYEEMIMSQKYANKLIEILLLIEEKETIQRTDNIRDLSLPEIIEFLDLFYMEFLSRAIDEIDDIF